MSYLPVRSPTYILLTRTTKRAHTEEKNGAQKNITFRRRMFHHKIHSTFSFRRDLAVVSHSILVVEVRWSVGEYRPEAKDIHSAPCFSLLIILSFVFCFSKLKKTAELNSNTVLSLFRSCS
jgi:hypothetical protein